MNQNIYRKEALARLASPEQLDQLMPLTSPRGWIALGTAALLLLMGLLWMIFGTISVQVEGRGVLLRPGGVHRVVAPEGGIVADIVVRPGDEVQPMQELLRITLAIGDTQPLPVSSPILGRVLEVAVVPRETVEKGASLVMLEALDHPLQAVVYLPAADAYRVERGMDVQVRPAAAQGTSSAILGRVRSAARYPTTRSQMLRTLGSEELVSALTTSGPCLELIIDVLPGADKMLDHLFSGTPCRAQITLYTQSPIQLMLPAPEHSQE